MVPLVEWLEAHKDRLITCSLQELSTRENLRQEAKGPVRWFFDNLIQTIGKEEPQCLETLLRNWVAMCSIPINGQTVGLLPVLGVFKRAIWQVFLDEPPSETPLALAAQLDATISNAAEFLSKIEAAALLDALTHELAVQSRPTDDELDNMKDTFVSVAAHELKTPLTVIEGYAHMLKSDLPEAAHPREALMIRGIECGVVRLRELVEDLIDVSLVEIDLLCLEFQPVWLRRLLDIVETESRNAVQARKLTLIIKKDTIPAKPLIGDPERLLKAFQKVLANAIKYTPDGGRIAIYGRALNGFVEIVIEDTGIGIDTENLDLIFEKFSSASNPSLHSSGKVKFKGGGAGLGLVIAKGIIEAHGGSIWAESPGADEEKLPGSRFHLMIPARDVTSGEGMAPIVAKAASMLSGHSTTPEVGPVSAAEETVSAGEKRSLPAAAVAGKASQDGEAPEQETLRDTGRSTS
jgi:signal transduction histidine kinase